MMFIIKRLKRGFNYFKLDEEREQQHPGLNKYNYNDTLQKQKKKHF